MRKNDKTQEIVTRRYQKSAVLSIHFIQKVVACL